MKDIMERVAEEYGTTPEEVRKEMQEAIKGAWEGSEGRTMRQELFQGVEPSPELLIAKIAEYALLRREQGTWS